MAPRCVVLTDLDGTLLDARDFGYADALPAIGRLRAEEIPLIPVTSKTMAEMAPLALALGLSGPMIVESGGAIASREESGWTLIPLGVSVTEIRTRAKEIEARCGARLLLFSEMDEAAAGRSSGLTGEALGRSRLRQFDEPFLLLEGDLERVRRAAESAGLVVRQGGRFLHFCGPVTKGDAACRLLWTYPKRPYVIALGDSPMDADLLPLADVAVIVPGIDGKADAALREAVPAALIAPAPGPRGWNDAILAILDGRSGSANATRG
jgi:mannosyl-3-phosphoglycerate phosphatase